MLVTDTTHFLDADGNVAHELSSRRLIRYLGAIVAAVTTEPAHSTHEVDIRCRKRPGRKACEGKIQAEFETGTSNIIWRCTMCGDRGVIHHWQGTPWDKGGRTELPMIQRITYRHGLVSDDDLEDLSGLKTTQSWKDLRYQEKLSWRFTITSFWELPASTAIRWWVTLWSTMN